MSWARKLRSLSVKTKVIITVLGAGFAVLGASTYLSFSYWEEESRAVAEQQARLAAQSTRLSIEGFLNNGDVAAVDRALARLVRTSVVRAARVYNNNNEIIASSEDGDAARRAARVWLPSASELPPEGTTRVFTEDNTHSVHGFVAIGSRVAHVLEIEYSMSSVQAAMDRVARFGIGLMIVSLLFVAMIVYAMVERELVEPLQRTEQLAEQRRVMLEQRAGFAEVGELAAEMAHEFKRPLASIRSAVTLLEQEYTLPGNGQNLLGGIESQLERLSDTMQDVFGLAKPIGMDTEALDVCAVLDDALLQCSGNAQAFNVAIVRDYRSPMEIHGDARRLELAFSNLFNNAIDAMSGGGTLTIRARRNACHVDVEVRDTGVGIDATHLPDVLRPFYSTKPTGTGLGLPLVARIIQAHGGDLRIESKRNEGTTVFVSLKASTEEN
jgi:signal transduction histidine kinase